MEASSEREAQTSDAQQWQVTADGPASVESQPGPSLGYPNDPSVPDVYAEGVGVQIGYTTISLIFNHTTKHPAEVTPVAVVRMSLEQALITTQVLRKALKDYQKNVGPIRIPEVLMDDLDIDEEL